MQIEDETARLPHDERAPGDVHRPELRLDGRAMHVVQVRGSPRDEAQVERRGSEGAHPTCPRGDPRRIRGGVRSEVHADEDIRRIVGAHTDRAPVQEGAASLRRVVRRPGYQIPDERLLHVGQALVADGEGHGIGGDAAERVVGPVDRIEDEGRLAPAIDETGLLAQDVQGGLLVVEHAEDRFFCDPVDAGARAAVRTPSEDLRWVSRHRLDGVLDRLCCLEEKPFHRPTYRLSSYRIMARPRAKARLRVPQGREDSARNFPTGHGEDENGEGKPAGATDRAQPRGRNDVREDQEDGDSRHDKSDRCGRENRILESGVFRSNGGSGGRWRS